MRTILIVFMGLALATAGLSAANASQVTAEWNLDTAGSTFGSFGGAGLSTARGQQFKALVSGSLETVALRMGKNVDTSEPLLVEVYAIDASGLPVGGPLATGEFASTDLPAPGSPAASVVFSFPTGGGVVAENDYAITVRPVTIDPTQNIFYVNGSALANATYLDGDSLRSADGGASWALSTSTDWGFRVVVDETTAVEAATWGAVKRLFR